MNKTGIRPVGLLAFDEIFTSVKSSFTIAAGFRNFDKFKLDKPRNHRDDTACWIFLGSRSS